MVLGFIALLLTLGAVLGWVAFGLVLGARRRLAALEHEWHRLRLGVVVPTVSTSGYEARGAGDRRSGGQGDAVADESPVGQRSASSVATGVSTGLPPESSTTASTAAKVDASEAGAVESVDSHPGAPALVMPSAATRSRAVSRRRVDATLQGGWWSALRRRWVEALAAASLLLAALWSARLALEQQWIGPVTQVVIGSVVGFALHVVALRGRARIPEASVAWAVLAGAASALLYGMGLVALHLHALVPPSMTLLWLGIVAVATVVVAGRHAPATRLWLIILGLIGGHAAPFWLSSDDGSALILLYAMVLTVVGLLALRGRFVVSLWVLVLVGAGFWAMVALLAGIDARIVLLYSAVLGVSLFGVPGGLLWTRAALARGTPGLFAFWCVDRDDEHRSRVATGSAGDARSGVLAALRSSLWTHRYAHLAIVVWLAVVALSGVVGIDSGWQAPVSAGSVVTLCLPLVVAAWWALGHAALRWAPGVAFVVLLGVLWWWGGVVLPVRVMAVAGLPVPDGGPLDGRFIDAVSVLADGLGTLYQTLTALAVSMLVIGFLLALKGRRAEAAAMIWLAPLAALGVAWAVTPAESWPWWVSAGLLALALAIAGGAWHRLWRDGSGVWVIFAVLAAHLAYALSALGWLAGGSLTVALAVLVLSAVSLWRRYALTPLAPLVRVLAWAIVLRLGLTPLLPSGEWPETALELWPYVTTAAMLWVAVWWARLGFRESVSSTETSDIESRSVASRSLAAALEGAALVATVWMAHLALRLARPEIDASAWPDEPVAALWAAALWAGLALAYAVTLERGAVGRGEGSGLRRLWVAVFSVGALTWVVWALVPRNPLFDFGSAMVLAEGYASSVVAVIAAWGLPAGLAAGLMLILARRVAAFSLTPLDARGGDSVARDPSVRAADGANGVDRQALSVAGGGRRNDAGEGTASDVVDREGSGVSVFAAGRPDDREGTAHSSPTKRSSRPSAGLDRGSTSGLDQALRSGLNWVLAQLPLGQRLAAYALMASAVVIVIRVIWQGVGASVHISTGFVDGELWSYTAAGVALAIGLTWLRGGSAMLGRVAVVVLGATALKVFLIDIWWLADLWRAASAMTLGLGLLGFAVLRARRPMVSPV